MVDVVKSATFDRWLRKLKDRRAATDPAALRRRQSSQDRDINEAHRLAKDWKSDEQDD